MYFRLLAFLPCNLELMNFLPWINKDLLTYLLTDMTSFVRDKQSHLALFSTIKLFSTYSGLCINHDKTEVLLLGNMEMKCSDLGVKEMSKVIKILSVHFTHNYSLFWKMNFETIEKSLKESLKGWNWRGLTLFGKIQVIKSFAIPKNFYRASLQASFILFPFIRKETYH